MKLKFEQSHKFDDGRPVSEGPIGIPVELVVPLLILRFNSFLIKLFSLSLNSYIKYLKYFKIILNYVFIQISKANEILKIDFGGLSN